MHHNNIQYNTTLYITLRNTTFYSTLSFHTINTTQCNTPLFIQNTSFHLIIHHFSIINKSYTSIENEYLTYKNIYKIEQIYVHYVE
jgi:hypothetical protein